jgi:hypothetical protein
MPNSAIERSAKTPTKAPVLSDSLPHKTALGRFGVFHNVEDEKNYCSRYVYADEPAHGQVLRTLYPLIKDRFTIGDSCEADRAISRFSPI